MPKLFQSTTANSSYSLFMGPREAAFINDVNTELMEIVAQQNFNYWPIEKDLSEITEIYGESERKVSRGPTQVYGLLELDEPETVTNNFTTETRRRIQAYLHIDRLTEVGIYPRKGDFLEWDNQMFEITETIVPNFVHGLPEVKVGVTVRCISSREEIFSPRTENEYDQSIDHNTQDPY